MGSGWKLSRATDCHFRFCWGCRVKFSSTSFIRELTPYMILMSLFASGILHNSTEFVKFYFFWKIPKPLFKLKMDTSSYTTALCTDCCHPDLVTFGWNILLWGRRRTQHLLTQLTQQCCSRIVYKFLVIASIAISSTLELTQNITMKVTDLYIQKMLSFLKFCVSVCVTAIARRGWRRKSLQCS